RGQFARQQLALRCDTRLDVAYIADSLGRRQVCCRHRFARRKPLVEHSLEGGIFHEIASGGPLPATPEPRHSVPDMQEKGFPLLLAIIADIDTGGTLPG